MTPSVPRQGSAAHPGAHTGSVAAWTPPSPVRSDVMFIGVPPLAGITHTSWPDP